MPLDFEQAKQSLEQVRNKYPQYADLDDAELSSALAEKYPQYQDIKTAIHRPRKGLTTEEVKRVAQDQGISVKDARQAAEMAKGIVNNIRFGDRSQEESAGDGQVGVDTSPSASSLVGRGQDITPEQREQARKSTQQRRDAQVKQVTETFQRLKNQQLGLGLARAELESDNLQRITPEVAKRIERVGRTEKAPAEQGLQETFTEDMVFTREETSAAQRPPAPVLRSPSEDPSTIADVARSIPAGYEEFVNSIMTLTGKATGSDLIQEAARTNKTYQPKTVPGMLSKPLTQFLIPFAGTRGAMTRLGLVPRGTGWGSTLARGAIEGAPADFLAFQGHTQRLSDFVQQAEVAGVPLANPVTEFMQAKEDDSEVLGRIKNVMEGSALGAMAEPFVTALVGVKQARSGSPEQAREALARSSQEVREQLLNRTGIDPEDMVSPVEAKILQDNPKLLEEVVKRRQAGQQIEVGTRRGKPLIRPRGEPEPGVGAGRSQEPGDVAATRPAAGDRGPTPAGPSGREELTTGVERQTTSGPDIRRDTESVRPKFRDEEGNLVVFSGVKKSTKDSGEVSPFYTTNPAKAADYADIDGKGGTVRVVRAKDLPEGVFTDAEGIQSFDPERYFDEVSNDVGVASHLSQDIGQLTEISPDLARRLTDQGTRLEGRASVQPAGQGTGGIRSTLNETQALIWDQLDPETPRSVREISELTGKPLSTVRRNARQLVQKGGADVQKVKERGTEINTFTRKDKEIRPEEDPTLLESDLGRAAERTPISKLQTGVDQMNDMLARLKSKPAKHLRVKDEFIRTVRDFLPRSEQGKVLSWYGKVKGAKSLTNAIERTRAVLRQHHQGKALGELKSTARTVDLARMRDEHAGPIKRELRDAKVQVKGKDGTRMEPVIKEGKDGRSRLDQSRLVRWARENDKTPEEIRELRELLQLQSTKDRNTDKFLGLARGQRISAAQVEAIRSVEESRSPLRGAEFSSVPEEASSLTRAGRFTAQLIDQVTYDGFVWQLARANPDQPLYQILSNGLRLGWRNKQKWFRQGEESMIKAIRDHLGMDWTKRPFQRYISEEIDVPGTGRMTREEAMKLYALSTDDQVRQNLPNASVQLARQPARKLQVQDLDNVSSALTDRERGFVDSVKAFWRGPIWHAIQNTHRQIKGFDLHPIRGYEPVRREALDDAEELFNAWHKFERQTLDNLNLQKARTGGDKRAYVVKGFITDYLDHLEQASRYASLAIPVRDAQSLLNNKDLRSAITSRYGKHGLDFIEQGIRHVMGFKHDKRSLIDNNITALARNFAASRLVFNVGSAAKQYFALLTNLADDVNSDRALMQALRENALFDRQIRERMEALSPEAYHRFNHSFISQLFSGGLGARKKGFWTDLQEKGFVLQRTADKQTLSALWRASEIDVAREMGLDPSKAIAGRAGRQFTERVTDKFETALAREQATDNPTQLSWFDMRARESPVWRLGTLFRRELNRVYNTMRRPVVEAIQNPSQATFQKAAKAVLTLGPALMVGEHLINEGRDVILSGGRKDRPGIHPAGDHALQLMEGMVGRLYGVGNAAGFISQMARGNKLFAAERLNSPIGSFGMAAWRAGSQITETAYRMNGERIEQGVRRGMTNTTQEVMKTIEKSLDFAGFLGVPLWAIANQSRRLYEWTETDIAKMVNFERELRRLKDELEDATGSKKRRLRTKVQRMEGANSRINSIHRSYEKGRMTRAQAHGRIIQIIEQNGGG